MGRKQVPIWLQLSHKTAPHNQHKPKAASELLRPGQTDGMEFIFKVSVPSTHPRLQETKQKPGLIPYTEVSLSSPKF